MFANPTFTGTANATNLTLSGNLTVNGTTTTISTTNLEVEDRFVFLNAGGGSASNEGGIIVESATAGKGNAFFYDSVARRWSFAQDIDRAATDALPDAYVAAVFQGEEAEMQIAGYDQIGNIRIANGEVFIVVE